MKVRLWGTRGSVPTPRAGTTGYGGNTACVTVRAVPRNLIILDAGTGICSLGSELDADLERIDILLTHLHMDHIIGLGFFDGLFRNDLEVHLWGPSSVTLDLGQRLNRYLSPPLFPILLRDLPCELTLHDVPDGPFELPGVRVTAARVLHPGPTVGYRIEADSGVVAYLPDHEPALGTGPFPGDPVWTSGHDLSVGADLLIHDAQYTDAEYADKIGWGHSSFDQAVVFARFVGARHLVLFHHDPSHDDSDLDVMHRTLVESSTSSLVITSAREGQIYDVTGAGAPAEVTSV